MTGYQKGAITGGIGQGINTAVAGIMNLYGLRTRLDQQQQNIDIQKQNSATYHKMMHYTLASRFERDAGEDLSKWRTPSGTGTRAPLGGVDPRARRMGVDTSLDVDPRYLQPGADALLD